MIIPGKASFPGIIIAAHGSERWRVEQMRATIYAHEERYADKGDMLWARLMHEVGLDVDKIAKERWPDWQDDAYMYFKVRIPKIDNGGFE